MNKKQIKEINQHISDALVQWSNIMTTADADDWAYLLEYSDEDLLNALFIFQHVAQNIAIKAKILTEENCVDKISSFRQSIKDTFGFDTKELVRKVMLQYEVHKRSVAN